MKRALLIAKKAILNNNIPIGSVLVNKNFEIGIGFNYSNSEIYPFLHAEINALKQGFFYSSNKYLKNNILYITLEPCFLCLPAIFYSKIKHIIFAAYYTDNIKSIKKIKQLNRTIYLGGFLEKESNNLIKDFFKK